MEKKEALQILIQSIEKAQSVGAYTLNEVSIILEAIKAFSIEQKVDDNN